MEQSALLKIIMPEIVAIQAFSFWHSPYALDSLLFITYWLWDKPSTTHTVQESTWMFLDLKIYSIEEGDNKKSNHYSHVTFLHHGQCFKGNKTSDLQWVMEGVRLINKKGLCWFLKDAQQQDMWKTDVRSYPNGSEEESQCEWTLLEIRAVLD